MKHPKRPPLRICYKTVRSDGSSIYAPPGIGRCYEIGRTYRFPKRWPTFVFTAGGSLKNIYHSRAEPCNGNRVLICLARVSTTTLEVVNLWTLLNIDNPTFWHTAQTATQLTVIGEIFVPEAMREYPLANTMPTLTAQKAKLCMAACASSKPQYKPL